MKRSFLIFIALFLLGLTTFAQKQVIPIRPDSNAVNVKNSFTYALPKTAFLVEVTVEKVSDYKGCYADYAASLMGLSDFVKVSQDRYEVKEIKVRDFLVPDEEHQFLVHLSGKQMRTGFLSEIFNDKYSLKDQYYTPFMDSLDENMPDFFRYYSNMQYEEIEESYLDTRIVDGVVTQVLVNQTKTIEKSSRQQAQDVAELIAKIRNDRYDLLTGKQEVPYSKEAMEYMVTSLNELEQNYLYLFSGLSVKRMLHYNIVVVPDDEHDLLVPIFSFSEKAGLTEPNLEQNAGNYYLKVSPQLTMNTWNEYCSAAAANRGYKPNKGYRIRQALPANLSLVKDNDEFSQLGVYQLYQLGKVQILPPNYDNLDIHHWGFIY